VSTVLAPPIDSAFQALLVRALEESRKRNGERKERTGLYVSEVGTVIGESACHRKLWYDLHDAPRDPLTPETLMAFEVGDVVGLRVANLLAALGEVQKLELRATFDGPLSGRLDLLLAGNLKRVVEIKTIPIAQEPYLPKQEHIRQLNLYLDFVRRQPDYADYQGTLAYVFKDARKGMPTSKPFYVEYDAGDAQTTLRAYQTAWDTARGMLIPERPTKYTQSKWPCAYCSFLTQCWKTDDRKVIFNS
jgi:CRISPR/Cas system-associated exonuclease Cas4 (RecB family)